MRWLVGAGILLAMASGGFLLWVPGPPGTPQELFQVRCSTCHDRPDLAGYTAREKRGIVMTMLREKGADKVISAGEAAQIIDYITARAIEINDKDQGDGDT